MNEKAIPSTSNGRLIEADSGVGAGTEGAIWARRDLSGLQADSEPAAVGFQRYAMAAGSELYTPEHTGADPLLGGCA